MSGTDPPASTPVETRAAPLTPEPPEWVREWIDVSETTTRPLAHAEGTLVVARGDGHTGLRANIDDADCLSDGQFVAAVQAAYVGIRQELARAGRHPIRFRSVRVHLPDGRDVSRVAPLVESRFRQACHVEFCEADLCRRDLLVEIEGVASLHE